MSNLRKGGKRIAVRVPYQLWLALKRKAKADRLAVSDVAAAAIATVLAVGSVSFPSEAEGLSDTFGGEE